MTSAILSKDVSAVAMEDEHSAVSYGNSQSHCASALASTESGQAIRDNLDALLDLELSKLLVMKDFHASEMSKDTVHKAKHEKFHGGVCGIYNRLNTERDSISDTLMEAGLDAYEILKQFNDGAMDIHKPSLARSYGKTSTWSTSRLATVMDEFDLAEGISFSSKITIRDVKGDGMCLFRAVANGVTGDERTWKSFVILFLYEVLKDVSISLREHDGTEGSETYYSYVLARAFYNGHLIGDEDPENVYRQSLEKMVSGDRDYWAGDNEADILSRALGVCIVSTLVDVSAGGIYRACVSSVFRGAIELKGLPVIIVNTGEHWESGLEGEFQGQFESKSLSKYKGKGKGVRTAETTSVTPLDSASQVSQFKPPPGLPFPQTPERMMSSGENNLTPEKVAKTFVIPTKVITEPEGVAKSISNVATKGSEGVHSESNTEHDSSTFQKAIPVIPQQMSCQVQVVSHPVQDHQLPASSDEKAPDPPDSEGGDMQEPEVQYPNPHAESLMKGAQMFTRDELSNFKGVDSSMWSLPKEVQISRNFNASNLASVDTLIDSFTDYAGKRWPGLGQSLMMRVTRNLWDEVRTHHSCRSMIERTNHQRQFRSIYFHFSSFEIQLLEQWMGTLSETIPVWLRKAIQLEIRSLLNDEEDTSSSGLGGIIDEDAASLGTALGSDGGGFGSNSTIYIKMNSNLYSFDALLFLVIIRVYSGHGTEREQILSSACEFKMKDEYGLAQVENVINNFVATWRSVEKFGLTLQEPASLWKSVYQTLMAFLSSKLNTQNVHSSEWAMILQWLNSYILENSMNNLATGDLHVIFTFLKKFRMQLRNIMQSAGVSSLNASDGERSKKQTRDDRNSQLAQVNTDSLGKGQDPKIEHWAKELFAIKEKRLAFTKELDTKAKLCRQWLKSNKDNRKCSLGEKCPCKDHHIQGEVAQEALDTLSKNTQEALEKFPDPPGWSKAWKEQENRRHLMSAYDRVFYEKKGYYPPKSKGKKGGGKGKGGKGSGGKGKGQKGKGSNQTPTQMGQLILDDDEEDRKLLESAVQDTIQFESFNAGMFQCTVKGVPDFGVLSLEVQWPPQPVLFPYPGKVFGQYDLTNIAYEILVIRNDLTDNYVDSASFSLCKWKRDLTEREVSVSDPDFHYLRTLITHGIERWVFVDPSDTIVVEILRRPFQGGSFESRVTGVDLKIVEQHMCMFWKQRDQECHLTDFYGPRTDIVPVFDVSPRVSSSQSRTPLTEVPASAPVYSDSWTSPVRKLSSLLSPGKGKSPSTSSSRALTPPRPHGLETSPPSSSSPPVAPAAVAATVSPGWLPMVPGMTIVVFVAAMTHILCEIPLNITLLFVVLSGISSRFIVDSGNTVWAIFRCILVIYLTLLFCNPLGSLRITATILEKSNQIFGPTQFLDTTVESLKFSTRHLEQGTFRQAWAARLLLPEDVVRENFYAMPNATSGSGQDSNRTCLDSGAARSLIRPHDGPNSSKILDGDRDQRSIGMTLAGGVPGSAGRLWASGEVRKPNGRYDQLLSLGRLVSSGATVLWNMTGFYLTLPSGKIIEATISNFCPYVNDTTANELREVMREDKRSVTLNNMSDVSNSDLALVIQRTGTLVDYSKFALSEVTNRWIATDRKVRPFLNTFLEDESPFTLYVWDESVAVQSFNPVNRTELLKRLRAQGPILVEHTATSANQQVAPKKKTLESDRLKSAVWDGFDTFVTADLHSVGKDLVSYDGSSGLWIFAIHRRRTAAPDLAIEDSSHPALLLGINVSDNSQSSLQNAILEVKTLVDLGRFKLRMERESATGASRSVSNMTTFSKWLAAEHGALTNTVPFRHPSFEVWIGIYQRNVRAVLKHSVLPVVLWPEASRVVNYSNLKAYSASSAVQAPCISNPYFHERLIGDLGFFKPERPQQRRSTMHTKGVPGIILGPRMDSRFGVAVLYSYEKADRSGSTLNYTVIDSRGFLSSDTKGFEEKMDNLSILKQLRAPFDSVIKKITLPSLVSCKACLRDGGAVQGRGRPSGHTCADGCCYRQELSLSDLKFEVHPSVKTVSMSQLDHCLETVVQQFRVTDIQGLATEQSDVEGGSEKLATSPLKEITYPELGDTNWYQLNTSPIVSSDQSPFAESLVRNVQTKGGDRSVVELFKERSHSTSSKKRRGIFNQLKGDSDEEEAAVLFYAHQDIFMASLQAERATEVEKLKRTSSVETTKFYALVLSTKEAGFLAQDPEVRAAIINGDNRELSTLINDGVLRLVELDELNERRKTEKILIIPSLVVRTYKPLESRHKSRLVACGNFERVNSCATTYAPVVDLPVVKMMLSIALAGRGSAATLDIREAFCQTSVECSEQMRGDNKLFLRLPSAWKSKLCPDLLQGINEEDYSKIYFEVLRSIYGLASAPIAWYNTLSTYIIKDLQFKRSVLDESLFFRWNSDRTEFIVICVYVDDVWVAGTWVSEVHKVVNDITTRYRSTEPTYLFNPPSSGTEPQPFLTGHTCTFITNEISVVENSEGGYRLIISQDAYLSSTVKKLIQKGCISETEAYRKKPSLDLKLYTHQKLMEDTVDNPLLNPQELTSLRSIVNSLGYLASTRPDLMAGLGCVARGQAGGRKQHLIAARGLVAYASSNRRRFEIPIQCHVEGGAARVCLSISSFFDANLSSDQFSRMGYFVNLVIGSARSMVPLMFKSALSTTTCTSTTESELGSANFQCRAVEGYRNVLQETFSQTKYEILSSTCCGDNEAANLIASNQAGLRQVRHLSLQNFYVRSLTAKGSMVFKYVESWVNPADMLTKILPTEKLMNLLEKVMIVPY